MKVTVSQNPKTKFMRMCIAEAILALLETTDFAKLKISDIVRKAGVARMSFYKYYDSPYAALTDYLQIIISEYMQESPKEQERNTYLEYSHILYSLNFFDRYADFFLILSKNKLHSILLDGINGFMEENIRTAKQLSVYEMYSYAGGLLNTFLKWEEGGKQEAAEEVAQTIYRLYCAGGQQRKRVLSE